jgi:chromatin segregation and condensation protein Rec8/ScpA/Scc1 (kleisin family)
MFKEFLNASERINDIIKDGNSMFSPRYKKRDISRLTGDDDLFSPPKKLKADDLAQILREFIEKQGKKEKHKLEEREIEYKINIEEKIIEIQKKLVKRLSYSFKKLMNGAGSRTEVIVSFLAILELAKQKSVNLEQEDAFADIIVRRYGRDA